MRKTLLYGVAAIVLGTVTMLVPSMLLKPSYYDDPFTSQALLGGGEGTSVHREREAFQRAVSPLSLLSTGLLLLPSFLLALGVFVYARKRMF